MVRVVNEKSYVKNHTVTRRLTVEFMCDPVPGAWHDPIDLMNHIAQHSYVKCVELIEGEV